MPATNASQEKQMKMIFWGDDYAAIGSGLVSTDPDGSLYVSLHTGDPGAAADQTTSEASYTNYTRQAVARVNTAWTYTDLGNDTEMKNTAVIDSWAQAGSAENLTYFGIGTDVSGAGHLLFYGLITTGTLQVTSGDTPETPIGALKVTML